MSYIYICICMFNAWSYINECIMIYIYIFNKRNICLIYIYIHTHLEHISPEPQPVLSVKSSSWPCRFWVEMFLLASLKRCRRRKRRLNRGLEKFFMTMGIKLRPSLSLTRCRTRCWTCKRPSRTQESRVMSSPRMKRESTFWPTRMRRSTSSMWFPRWRRWRVFHSEKHMRNWTSWVFAPCQGMCKGAVCPIMERKDGGRVCTLPPRLGCLSLGGESPREMNVKPCCLLWGQCLQRTAVPAQRINCGQASLTKSKLLKPPKSSDLGFA